MAKGRPFEEKLYDKEKIVELSYVEGCNRPRSYKHIAKMAKYNYRNMMGWVRYNCIESRGLQFKEKP